MTDIQYTWNFNPLEVVFNEDSMENIIKTVHWQYVATFESASVQSIGTVSLETPPTGSFIPFKDISKETVTTWVEQTLGQEVITNMQTSLSSSISNLLYPTSGVVPPPWG